MNQNFGDLLDYIGWGEPHQALWFIGSEESEGSTETHIQQLRTRVTRELDITYEPPAARSGPTSTKPIGQFESSVVERISARSSGSSQTNLWGAGSKTFHGNLWPLGRKNDRVWPPPYAEIYDLGDMTLEEYKEYCRKHRFPKLAKFHTQCAPLATICCGRGAWADFTAALQIAEENWNPHNEGRMRISGAKNRVILTHHWGWYRYTLNGPALRQQDVDLIVKTLADWNVRLP